MDGSASLAIGETFAGRVVKVKHHDDDEVDDDQHGGQYNDDDDDPGATGGWPGGQGGEGRYQQVLEGDGRREQQSRYHDDYGDDNDSIII